MGIKKIALVAAIAPLAFASQSATAGCWSEGTSCLWYVPSYNQHDPALSSQWFINGGTNLCAPTAAAMALTATMNLNNIKDSNGWTNTSFANQGKIQKIENMASLMSSTPEDGTSNSTIYAQYKGRKPEVLTNVLGLKIPLMKVFESYGASIDLNAFLGPVQKPTALVANYGHYNKVTVKIIALPNLKYLERGYLRDGGHAITPRGVLGDIMYYNDPSGGTLRASRIAFALPKNSSVVKNGVTQQVVETLPGGAARLAYLDEIQSANYYPIMEGVMALRY